MNYPEPKENEKETGKDKENVKTNDETKQQQSDPQLTELKGLTDPDEDLEVKGTDNPF
jgi:hypothetical protein